MTTGNTAPSIKSSATRPVRIAPTRMLVAASDQVGPRGCGTLSAQKVKAPNAASATSVPTRVMMATLSPSSRCTPAMAGPVLNRSSSKPT